MFLTLLICHLDCCNALVTRIAKGQGKRLQAVQNASARLVSGLIAVTTQCHYWAIFFGCQWDDQGVASRVIFKTAVLVWKCIHGVTAVHLQELCTQVDSIRGRPRLRSASTGGIQLPRVQTSVAQRSFASYNGPAVWNSLPATLRDSSVSLHAFKRRLKTYLFAAWWTPSGAVAAFLRVSRRYIRLLIYLLTSLLNVSSSVVRALDSRFIGCNLQVRLPSAATLRKLFIVITEHMQMIQYNLVPLLKPGR